MMPIPDPSWKTNPDIVADETAAERYADDGYTIFDDDLAEEEIGEEQEETALIAITQLPQIVENLHALRESWEAKAAEAATLVCTDESIQSIKKMRADMRKEFDEADTQRKAVKERYMSAWNEVDATWKECVAEPFLLADGTYKALINEFEGELKDECRNRLQSYFSELCAAHGVDFLTFDQAMGLGKIKISMADANAKTPKKLMDALSEVVAKVAVGMDQINAMPEDERAEIMDEYKQRFDVGSAIATVQARRKRIESEREAAEARRAERERQKAAVARVEALAPPEPAKPQEKVFEEFSFTVYNCTRSQLLKIRDFLKQEGIKYE